MEVISHSDSKASSPYVGIQYLVDFFGCKNIPTTSKQLEDIMIQATILTGATVVESVFHEYNPYGLSGVVIIAESHFAIHTWPEYQVASVDLFSCGKISPQPGIQYIQKQFEATDINITEVKRGLIIPD